MSTHSQLLVKAWADAGAIPKFMFSINYKSYDDGADSYIYFGGYEAQFAASDDEVDWFPITDSGYWEI